MTDTYSGKVILITGGTGSIGSAIVRRLLPLKPRAIRVFSNDENGIFNMERELEGVSSMRFLLGDIRDAARVSKAAEGVDIVFHAAALKHVPLCEFNPYDAVQTNVQGTRNIVDAAIKEDVAKLITISTDKAVNPINVMGATKLLAERLTVSANFYKGPRRTAFSCVRFGNVLGSRGSVLPVFREQIAGGEPVTVTNPDMTRFVMNQQEAAGFILNAAEITRGGEIFILKMPALRIADLAAAMIEEYAPRYGRDPAGIKIETTGKRVGEKDHETLLTGDEAVMTRESEGMFIISPPEIEDRKLRKVSGDYTSVNAGLLAKDEIINMLREIDPPPLK